ncbi:hypothetical protein RB594_000693 [Gaeumannomyces avenae]
MGAPDKRPTPGHAKRDNSIIVEQVRRYLSSTGPEILATHDGQVPGTILETPQGQAYVGDALVEMAVQWMDVRWRALEGYWGREEAPPKRPSPRRRVKDTKNYINSFVHGGNLRHDTVITSIGYAKNRLDDGPNKKDYESMQEHQFYGTYGIELEFAEWLIQQQKPQDPHAVGAIDYPRVINIIDRYITCYAEETQINKGIIKSSKKRKRDPSVGTAKYKRFMDTVSQICAHGRVRKSPIADKDLTK